MASRFRAYGARCAVCLFFALIATPTTPGKAAAGGQTCLDELVARADSRRLADDRYWQTLLHYRPAFGGGVRSLVDDPRFFLAPDGKANPEAELVATLRGFFQEGGGDDAPRCRFPARFAWLREKLGIDAERLPPATCSELDKAVAAADPRGAVLVFPAAHMNNPASMFGHTLLRIDNSYHSELLAYAVNYAAVTDETNGFAYAAKGIFGLYKGYYSILPYYDKVREYSDMEHRDMWEYALDLTPEETRRMVLHIWELRNISSDYFFFDENCSYNLLFLLEAARPTVHLTDRAAAWVIPSDTVRAVRKSGLISRVKYRPSQAARIRRISATLSNEERRLAMNLIEVSTDPATVTTPSAGALDLAAELLQYRYARREIEKEAFNRLYLALLTRRSALGPSAGTDYAITPPAQPEEGHRTNRAGLGGGYRKDRPFVEFAWRPAYHDLLDQADGYLPGAQINFLDTHLRYYPSNEELRLHRLRLVDIVSLSPWDPVFRPISWKVSAGFDQELHRDDRDHLVFRLSTGGGFAAATGERGIVYIIGDTDILAGEQLRNGAALGFGASAGLLVDLLPDWKLHLTTRGIYYPAGDTHLALKGEMAQNIRLGRDQSIQLTVRGERAFGRSQLETAVHWLHFF
jgi:hypothetical protein